MSASSPYLVGVVLALVASGAAVLYLRRPLHAVLVDLCGTPERARFWTAFSNETLILVPVAFALGYDPEFGPKNAVLQVGGQLKFALLGEAFMLVVIGLVLSIFISKVRPAPPKETTHGTAA
jgi:hypothetical protein